MKILNKMNTTKLFTIAAMVSQSMIFMTSLHRHTGRRIVIYVTWNWNSPQRSLEKTQMEPNGDMVTDSRGRGYVISFFDLIQTTQV